jgi:predicted nucleotidyltransferase
VQDHPIAQLQSIAVKRQIDAFCRRHHIRKLSLFGSILRSDFGPESDIDFLIEFDREHIPDLFQLAGMEMELSEIIGRQADLRTPNDLSRHFRHQVMAEAIPQYVQTG